VVELIFKSEDASDVIGERKKKRRAREREEK
jgi:hypothetical protein